MKVNFNFILTDLYGKDILDQEKTPLNAGSYLVSILSEISTDRVEVVMNFAKNLVSGQDFEVSQEDAQIISIIIEKSNIINVIKYQLISVLKD